MKKFYLILILIVSFYISSCVEDDPITQPTLTYEKRVAIEKLLDSVIAADDIPGIVFAVQNSSGQTDIIESGYADIVGRIGMRYEKTFGIGTATKMFIATIVLQLVDENKIGLDDKITKFLPDFPNGEKITIRHLLSMASGLKDVSANFNYNSHYRNTPELEMDRNDLFGFCQNDTLQFIPGEKVNYCNTNYILLGLIVGKVTGKDIEDEISNRITIPLRMSITELPRTILPSHVNIAVGYKKNDAGIPQRVSVHPSILWTAGGMVSNAKEMIVFIDALNRGELISEEMLDVMKDWKFLVERKNSVTGEMIDKYYGCGLIQKGDLWGYMGDIQGFSTISGHYITENVTIVLWVNLSNHDNDYLLEDVFEKIMQIIFNK